MEKLEQLQRDFMAFILNGQVGISDQVAEQGKIDPATRLSIYSNSYHARLYETIDTDHEILGLYLGDALFEQMVDGYIETHPSSLTSLRHYCDALPTYLNQTPPFNAYPQLAELAMFERRLMFSFDAAKAERINYQHLLSLSPDQWPALCFGFHPSMQLVTVTSNAVESWQALKAGDTPPDPIVGIEQSWLLWRSKDALTEFRSLPADEKAVFNGFQQGSDFSTACEVLLHWHSENEVTQRILSLLQSWFEAGLISSVK